MDELKANFQRAQTGEQVLAAQSDVGVQKIEVHAHADVSPPSTDAYITS